MLKLIGEVANVVGNVEFVRVCLALGMEFFDSLGSNLEILQMPPPSCQYMCPPCDESYAFVRIRTYLVGGEVALVVLGALGLLLRLRGVGRWLLGLLLTIPLSLLLAALEFSLGNHLARNLIKVEVLDGIGRLSDAISRRRRRRGRRRGWV